MLNSIQLKDFKRHDALEADFADGLNTIVGPNYAGKTSLIQAVLVAFFGPSALPGGAKVATRNGAKGFEINVSFEADGIEYGVRRTKTKAELSRDGKVIANSVSQVTAEIEQILGMSKKRFLQLKYAQQKRTEALLTLGAGELHNVIEEVTGADLISRVIERLKDEMTRTGARLDAMDESSASIEDLEKAADDAEAHLSYADEQAHAEHESTVTAEANEKAATNGLDSAKANNNKADVRDAKISSLKKQRDRAQARYDELEPDHVDPPTEADIESARRNATRLDERMDQAKVDRDQLQKKRAAMDKAKSEGQKAKADREKLNTEAPDPTQVDAAEQALEALRDSEASYKADQKAAADALESAVCPTCERPFESHDPEALRARRDDAQKKLSEVRDRIKEAEAHAKSFRDAKARADRDASRDEVLKQNYDTAVEEFRQAKESYQDLANVALSDGSLAELREEWALAKAEADRLKQDRADWERREQRMNEYLADRDQANSDIAKLELEDVERVDLEPFQEAFDKARSDLKEQQDAEREANRVLAEAKAAADAAHKELERAQEANKRRGELEGRVQNIRALTKFLRDNRDRFLADVWAGVMAQASEFASTCTGGYIESVVRQESGSFAYVENGEEQPIEAASGAQASIMGLGVQLALSRMLPSGFGATLLDEPTADMAEDHALTLTTALAALPQQIVMVSHREFDGSAAENVIQLNRD